MPSSSKLRELVRLAENAIVADERDMRPCTEADKKTYWPGHEKADIILGDFAIYFIDRTPKPVVPHPCLWCGCHPCRVNCPVPSAKCMCGKCEDCLK